MCVWDVGCIRWLARPCVVLPERLCFFLAACVPRHTPSTVAVRVVLVPLSSVVVSVVCVGTMFRRIM